MSKLPNIYAEPTSDGNVTVVADSKSRRLINKWFAGDPLPWSEVDSPVLKSPKYLAVELEAGPVPQLVLAQGHQHGLLVLFKCVSCPKHHVLDDALAERFLNEAAWVADNVLPAPEGLQ